MRIINLLLLLFAALPSFAQIQLDFTYHPAIGNSSGTEFSITAIDTDEYKYLYVNYQANQFTLYNMDHSIYEVVDIPLVWSNYNYKISYVTRTLFDCDNSNIEYLVNQTCQPQPCITGGSVEVLHTDGSSYFQADSTQVFLSFGGATGMRFPIVSTPQGTKLILNHKDGTNDVSVYALCGDLPGYPQYFSIVSDQEEFTQNSDFIKAYPNPTSDFITVAYELPESAQSADLQIMDLQGKLLRTYQVDRNFSSVLVDAKQFAVGTYIYRLVTEHAVSEGKQFVVSR